MRRRSRILRIFSFAALGLLVPSSAGGQAPDRDPRAHLDAADAAPSPLDIRSIAFGQRGTELFMRIETAGEWEPEQLVAAARSALCVRLFYGRLRTPRSQLCVFGRERGRTGLAYARLDPFGRPVENRIVGATISRPDRRTVRATFEPSAANLGMGRYSWQAVSTWPCGRPGDCEDRTPNNGNVIAQLRPLKEPPCFGAAWRNPRQRCRDPRLRLSVQPHPEEAVLSPNARCTIVSTRLPYTCGFGVRAAIADRTVALVGDSHAAHWRGAVEVVAQARRWRGYSVTRAGCPLSTATPALDRARRRSCQTWRRAVRRWFARHREVRTVFVSNIAGAHVRAPRGTSMREHQVRGFIRAWSRLPRTVRQVIVLRDTPSSTDGAPDCVLRALARRRRPDITCALARRRALDPDPAVTAARRTRDRRVHVVDLTRFMCGPRRCFPVVGGVLVHKDTTHLTPLFAGTLGPFLLRRVERLLG